MQRKIDLDDPNSFKLQQSTDSYAYFDLNLSDEQKTALEKMTIRPLAEYANDDELEELLSKMSHTNYGELDNLAAELNSYMTEKLGETNPGICLVVIELIMDIIKKVCDYYNQESALIMLRTTPSENKLYDIPRWHTDGSFFLKGEREYKTVVTLVGPGTLFYKLPDEQRSAFNEVSGIKLTTLTPSKSEIKIKAQESRMKTYAICTDESRIDSPAQYQGAMFVTGCKKTSMVHSEPKMTGKRFFLSVQPGSKEQIAEKKRSNEAFNSRLQK